jgi:hypothetical protein
MYHDTAVLEIKTNCHMIDAKIWCRLRSELTCLHEKILTTRMCSRIQLRRTILPMRNATGKRHQRRRELTHERWCQGTLPYPYEWTKEDMSSHKNVMCQRVRHGSALQPARNSLRTQLWWFRQSLEMTSTVSKSCIINHYAQVSRRQLTLIMNNDFGNHHLFIYMYFVRSGKIHLKRRNWLNEYSIYV